MDAAPYYSPTYFPPSYFYVATAPVISVSSTGVSPYNAPTYFPSSYFYGATAPAVSGSLTNASSYNAPTYFPPSYFYVGSSPSVLAPNSPEPQCRDQAAYAALIGLLGATGVFEEVIFGAVTQRSRAGADSYPLAIVTPRGWEEFDDYDPTSIVRRVFFAITIVVKGQDAHSQFGDLDRLSSAIQKVIDRSDLGATCIGPLTRIRSGRYESSTHFPEQSVDLEGEFSSILDS